MESRVKVLGHATHPILGEPRRAELAAVGRIICGYHRYSMNQRWSRGEAFASIDRTTSQAVGKCFAPTIALNFNDPFVAPAILPFHQILLRLAREALAAAWAA